MLLAEALALRADHQKRLKELSDRIASNARAPVGHDPDEDPDALLGEAAALAEELAALIRSINETNAGTVADPGTGASITDLIAERDKARQLAQLYRSAARAAGRGSGRGFLSYDRDAPTPCRPPNSSCRTFKRRPGLVTPLTAHCAAGTGQPAQSRRSRGTGHHGYGHERGDAW